METLGRSTDPQGKTPRAPGASWWQQAPLCWAWGWSPAWCPKGREPSHHGPCRVRETGAQSPPVSVRRGGYNTALQTSQRTHCALTQSCRLGSKMQVWAVSPRPPSSPRVLAPPSL